jgi:hypothetical protein
MIVATYVLAASLSERWGATILVFAQIGTVLLALRTSHARHDGSAGSVAEAALRLLVIRRHCEMTCGRLMTASAPTPMATDNQTLATTPCIHQPQD